MLRRLIKKRVVQPLYLFTLFALTTASVHANSDLDGLLSVARTYKDNQQWGPALRLYREGMQRFPAQPEFRVGLCLTLADAGQPEKALSCTQTLAATTLNPRYWLTRSYIHRVSGQPYEGLRASQHALALAPADAEVIRNHEQALHTARLNRQAVEWQERHEALFSPDERLERQADYAAELTRLAPQPTRTSAEHFAIARPPA